MKTIEDFNQRVKFFKDKYKVGGYANPYDTFDELEGILNNIETLTYGTPEYEFLLDIAQSTGELFWSL
jgi:hypothetical protein